MSQRRRFYLTTAIAYANNRPGLHTLYEVPATPEVDKPALPSLSTARIAA